MAMVVHNTGLAEIPNTTAYAECGNCQISSITVESQRRQIDDEKVLAALEALGWIQWGAEWFCPECQEFALTHFKMIKESQKG